MHAKSMPLLKKNNKCSNFDPCGYKVLREDPYLLEVSISGFLIIRKIRSFGNDLTVADFNFSSYHNAGAVLLQRQHK